MTSRPPTYQITPGPRIDPDRARRWLAEIAARRPLRPLTADQARQLLGTDEGRQCPCGDDQEAYIIGQLGG